MTLQILHDCSISEIKRQFNCLYPFLKIEFYPASKNRTGVFNAQHLTDSITTTRAGLIKTGNIEVHDLMTVGQLESIFRNEFGLTAQVSRKSGTIWLETTMTDNWTLGKQNEHGKELTETTSP